MLSAALANAHANEVFIRVSADGDSSASAECSFASSRECLVTFKAAAAMLVNLKWQESIPVDVRTVRLTFAAHNYRMNKELLIVWSGGAAGKTRLLIDGLVNRTVLNGSSQITNWRALHRDEYIDRIAETARPHILVAPISIYQTATKEYRLASGFGLPVRKTGLYLFSGNTRLTLAQWPNSGFSTIQQSTEINSDHTNTLSIEGIIGNNFQNEPELQLNAFWFNDWSNQTFNVKADDAGSFHITNGTPNYGIRPNQRIRILNALRELDSAGEWYIDHRAGLIFLWPVSSQEFPEIAISPTLVRIKNSKFVAIQNLTIEKSAGDAIVIEDSEHITLDKVIIQNSNRGLVVNGGNNVRLKNSFLLDFEEGGVSLSGGDRVTLTGSLHTVENSIIKNFSESGYTYRPAINLAGVGQRVSGNKISYGPHAAIVFDGNDHRIEGNEIHNVVQSSSDSGAIYTGRDYTARGTIIRRNFFHDIQPFRSLAEVKGIYLDDQASGITIEENVFVRVTQPVFIGGGRSNHVLKNVFVRSSPAIHIDSRGLSWQRAATTNHEGQLQTRLRAVPYSGKVWSQRYSNLSKILTDQLGSPKYNVVCGNSFIDSTPFSIAENVISVIDLTQNTETNISAFLHPNRAIKGESFSDFALRQPISNRCSEH